MAKKRKSTNSYRKQNHIFGREWNERCFLENKQKIKYHSFILLEIVPLEKKEDLIKGLDRLYAKGSARLKSKFEYKEALLRSHSKLFRRSRFNLPYVTTDKLKGKVVLPQGSVFHDLGDNIRNYAIKIYDILPSTVILQIEVQIDPKLSKKINGIIYKYHKELEEPLGDSGKSFRIWSPQDRKKNEIYSFRKELHKEAIEFLSRYFKGYFFELINEDVSAVPTIDLLSLSYPTKENDISEWLNKNSMFFSCLSTHMLPYTFKYESYLFSVESERDVESQNYLIFSNRKSGSDIYESLNDAIEGKINNCAFDLLAIQRWVRMQEKVVGCLNKTVYQEILNIKDNKFNEAIDRRKALVQEISSFQRLVIELRMYLHATIDKFPFKSIKDGRRPSRQVFLFEELKDGIEKTVKEIDRLINGFTRQYEMVLNLKNVEYNKKTQDKIILLTVVVIAIGLMDIIFLAFPEYWWFSFVIIIAAATVLKMGYVTNKLRRTKENRF